MTAQPEPLSYSLDETSATAAESHAVTSRLAAAEHLFVVTDFDGTLAGFASDIYAVQPNQRSLQALETLARLPQTTVAALSGRHLEGLRRVFPLGDPVILGGSHGAETLGEDSGLDATKIAELRRVGAELEALAREYPHTQFEDKPFQCVFNVLGLAEQDPAAALSALDRARAIDPGVLTAQEGKNIIEFSATTATKGTWIRKERARLERVTGGGRITTVFVGDDTTDEQGFEVLNQPPDAGVKVGAGHTAATVRVADIEGVADFFSALAEARRSQTLS